MLHVSGQLKTPEMATGVVLVDYGLLFAAATTVHEISHNSRH